MKTLKSYSRKLSSGFLVLVLVLSAAISCSKDDDGYGDNSGGNNNGNGSNTVQIRNFAFSPATITVSVGTTITWKNYDNVAHTVTSDEGLFDSGNISQNATFTQTFDSAGTYDYHCTPHPTMMASVVVN
jgi:plastocyanin